MSAKNDSQDLPAQTKQKGSNAQWSPQAEYDLASLCLKYQGHRKTDITMQEKWNTIAACITAEKAILQGYSLSGPVAQRKFDRMCETISKNAAICSEGANLSGLPPEPTPLEKLVLNFLSRSLLSFEKSGGSPIDEETENIPFRFHFFLRW